MKYLKIFISVILIFLGSTLLNITVNAELTKNTVLKISGVFVMFLGSVALVRAIKKEKLKNVE